jgi:hypothetical protein
VRQLLATMAVLLLAGCSGGPTLQQANPLVAPPWEAYVRAGPDAHKDIDYETLNGPSIATAQPHEVRIDNNIEVTDLPKDTETASAAAPDEPEPTPKDANAEVIKAVAVLAVRGSPELTEAMRVVLGDAGLPVITKKRNDALTIQGKVTISPPAGGQQVVKLVWLVTSPSGKLLGDVKQENTLPAGALDQGWGENALPASQAAAEGISKLIQRYR